MDDVGGLVVVGGNDAVVEVFFLLAEAIADRTRSRLKSQ